MSKLPMTVLDEAENKVLLAAVQLCDYIDEFDGILFEHLDELRDAARVLTNKKTKEEFFDKSFSVKDDEFIAGLTGLSDEPLRRSVQIAFAVLDVILSDYSLMDHTAPAYAARETLRVALSDDV